MITYSTREKKKMYHLVSWGKNRVGDTLCMPPYNDILHRKMLRRSVF